MPQCNSGCPKFKTMCGGQALIEGIMMRGPDKECVVVRKPDGELEIKTQPLKTAKSRHPWMGLPFLRGPINFIDSMVHGVRALMFSADYYPDEDTGGQPSKVDQWLERHLSGEKATAVVTTLALILGLGFSVLLFFVLPTLITGFLTRFLQNRFLLNLIEGLVRIAIFLLYIILVSQAKDIKRVFRYHGAEHQTIFCYENGLPLTVENVRQMPRHHPRCGTSFLFVIMFVSILLYAVIGVGWDNTLLRLAVRLLCLPVIVSITYEINRFVGRHDNWFTRILTAPGLWLQNFTTAQPDDGMMEVAITALSQVLPDEEGADAW